MNLPDRSKDSLDERGHLAQIGVRLEQSENACIGCRVSEPRKRSLEQCGANTLVVSSNPAILVQSLGGSCERGSIAVLVVHDGSDGLYKRISV